MRDIVEHILTNYIGIRERAGATNASPTIMRWKRNVIPSTKDDGQFAWCGIFAHNMLLETGYPTLPVAEAAGARNYQRLGEPVSEPQLGDLAIFRRGTGWQGHVAFVIRVDAFGDVWVLGGNQSNAVSIAKYSGNSLLGYRRLTK
jgi:uncharacterized protein (TIGR02594 family)